MQKAWAVLRKEAPELSIRTLRINRRNRESERRSPVSDRDAVSGDTPNLAARLQVVAAPGSVVISPSTRRLVGGLFELTELGPQRLKGFAQPLMAWRVAGEIRAEGRFEARQTVGPHALCRP
jgi:class 3 adenylate cyclase